MALSNSDRALVAGLSAVIGGLATSFCATLGAHGQYSLVPFTALMLLGLILYLAKDNLQLNLFRTNLVSAGMLAGTSITLVVLAASIIPEDAKNGVVGLIVFACIAGGTISVIIEIKPPEPS